MSHPHQAAPSQREALKTLLKHLWVPLYMGFAMALAYLGGFHQAAPHHVPVAIVASSPQAQAMAMQVQDTAGNALNVRTVPTAAQGAAEVAHGVVRGAFTPGASPKLVIDTSSSPTLATAVTSAFDKVAQVQNVPLKTTDLGPLPSSDPQGQGVFFLMVGITIGAYTLAATMGAAGGGLSFWRKGVIGVIGAAVVAALAVAVAEPILGALHGHWLELGLMSWLYGSAIVLLGTSFHTYFRKGATPALVTVFVALNFTTCGGVLDPALQPAFYRVLSTFWIGGGYSKGGLAILYHGGNGMTADLVRLACWFAAGAVALVGAALIEHRGKGRHEISVPLTPAEIDAAEEGELAGAAA